MEKNIKNLGGIYKNNLNKLKVGDRVEIDYNTLYSAKISKFEYPLMPFIHGEVMSVDKDRVYISIRRPSVLALITKNLADFTLPNSDEILSFKPGDEVELNYNLPIVSDIDIKRCQGKISEISGDKVAIYITNICLS